MSDQTLREQLAGLRAQLEDRAIQRIADRGGLWACVLCGVKVDGPGSVPQHFVACPVRTLAALASHPAGVEPGVGDYSCAVCGFGMIEPCEHWQESLNNKHAGVEPPTDLSLPPSKLDCSQAIASARLDEAKWWEHLVGEKHHEELASECMYCERMLSLERNVYQADQAVAMNSAEQLPEKPPQPVQLDEQERLIRVNEHVRTCTRCKNGRLNSHCDRWNQLMALATKPTPESEGE